MSYLLLPLLLLFAYYMIAKEKKLKTQQKELDSLHAYRQSTDELIDYVRERQHDFDNRIQTINAMTITNSDYESLCSAIRSYTGYIIRDRFALNLLKMNLRTFAGFLFSKEQEAVSQNKYIEFQINAYYIQAAIPEYDLIESAGILIDNALEAISESETIYITIDSQNNRCHLEVKNKGAKLNSTLRSEFFRKGFSTKNSSGTPRGLGLPKLKKLIDKYKGEIILYNEIIEDDTYIIFEIRV